jgi:indolepyruvate ferredoxin oxidoreductase alpha subunit
MTVSYMGVDAGLLIVTADDPGQHSSQNEQDNRNYAKFAKIPLLEPSDSQEAKDMVSIGFEVSEQFNTPVLLRTTTRIAHSKSVVECRERKEVSIKEYVKDVSKRMTVPFFARAWRIKVEERMEKLREYAETTPLNRIEDNGSQNGVITSGISYWYAREVFGENASYLKLGFTWPLPVKMIADFAVRLETIYVIEENDPYIEEAVRMLGIPCHGKSMFPFNLEMTPEVIRRSVYGPEKTKRATPDRSMILPRPPMLCAGCPHRGFFYELGKRKNVFVSGDIGCYGLGFDQPYNAMDTNLVMGASLGIAQGAQEIFNNIESKNKMRSIAVLGDSTFFHSGINGIINVLYNGANTVNVILDNRITAMTGHQENPGSGFTATHQPAHMIDIEAVVRTLGFKHVMTINPNDLGKVSAALDFALELDEPSVIITLWPCALKRLSEAERKRFANAFSGKYEVDESLCIGCKMCLKVGCPAVQFDAKRGKSRVSIPNCLGCGVCAQVCPKKAIVQKTA